MSSNCYPQCGTAVVNPGKVLDRTVPIEDTRQGYAAMDAREALKVMIKP